MSAEVFDWRAFLTEGPLFIGILNLTPDSFSDGGLHAVPEAALAQARSLLAKGFRMLDLGAESTRPGAAELNAGAEWSRLQPVLDLLRKEMPQIPLSVDTRHAEVAAQALVHGAAVLNDVTGFRDPAMLELASRGTCGLIAMRSRMEGGGFVMPLYGGEGEETADRAIAELVEVRERLRDAGIADTRAALDPGFGFGTTFVEDLAIWKALPSFQERLCIGVSRKRFTAWQAGQPDLPPQERDGLTAALHAEAAQGGVRIFRSHAATLPV
ncbi:MAG TPA: dihydropteroate synthase [Holophagaceae bacterium]|nr:dihydropteroate synthase [Holophagaceae bacterium]